jgi:hypothetical protein
MPCTRTPYGFICSRGRRTKRCAYCSAPGAYLCDFPVKAGTCDRPVCGQHRTNVGPEKDMCRDHAPLWDAAAGKPKAAAEGRQ